MKFQTLLFDLDGTVTDSGPGILNSVRYALEKAGMPEILRDHGGAGEENGVPLP